MDDHPLFSQERFASGQFVTFEEYMLHCREEAGRYRVFFDQEAFEKLIIFFDTLLTLNAHITEEAKNN